VVLRYYEDLPVAEVAAALGVGEGTVKRYLSEAMTRLAARLSPAESG
jgi:DNA-directed RNA polymerase specialized sigma24 family protein